MTPELSARVEASARAFHEAATRLGFWISSDLRIGEGDAEQLLGVARGYLKNLRGAGESPAFYRVGGAGHRVSYRLTDLAAWLESRREMA